LACRAIATHPSGVPGNLGDAGVVLLSELLNAGHEDVQASVLAFVRADGDGKFLRLFQVEILAGGEAVRACKERVLAAVEAELANPNPGAKTDPNEEPEVRLLVPLVQSQPRCQVIFCRLALFRYVSSCFFSCLFPLFFFFFFFVFFLQDPLTPKDKASLEQTGRTLGLLTQLCEGHNHASQEFLRSQPLNATSVNLLARVGHLFCHQAASSDVLKLMEDAEAALMVRSRLCSGPCVRR
jgi:hypothetical protein